VTKQCESSGGTTGVGHNATMSGGKCEQWRVTYVHLVISVTGFCVSLGCLFIDPITTTIPYEYFWALD
jgi:hypothetical protein